MISKKQASAVTGSLLLALALAGCGGSKGFADANGGRNALVGSWVKRSLSFGGTTVSCPNSLDGSTTTAVAYLTENNVAIDACGFNETITFNSNGTYQIVVPAPRFVQLTSESGTYKVSGNQLTLTRTATGYDANGDGVISGAEVTALDPVNSASSIPARPQQRAVYTFSVGTDGLSLTSVPQATTDGNGQTIVNSDKTVNASATGTTAVYGPQT